MKEKIIRGQCQPVMIVYRKRDWKVSDLPNFSETTLHPNAKNSPMTPVKQAETFDFGQRKVAEERDLMFAQQLQKEFKEDNQHYVWMSY